jgi:hypothetical protein
MKPREASPTVAIDAVRCACGAQACVIDPGEEPEVAEPTAALVRRGRPASGHCAALACWPAAPGVKQTLVEATP